jgi:hypothetical protein
MIGRGKKGMEQWIRASEAASFMNVALLRTGRT